MTFEQLALELEDCRSGLASMQSRLGSLESSLDSMNTSRRADFARIASPFVHYNSIFDVDEILQRHLVSGREATPGYVTNFLGVLIDPKVCPSMLAGTEGTVEPIPIPGNWHADMAEFGAALRAVDLANDRFTMIELGCGWGCWMNNTGMAARRRGLTVDLIGVEGDYGHIAFARETLELNGFEPSQTEVVRGITAVTGGVALFPRQEEAGANWGLEPIFGASEADRQEAVTSGKFDELPMIGLTDLLGTRERVDFLHMDIQGGEAALIEQSLAALTEKVAYMFVGTHSRQIEGRVFEALLGAGWHLEVERPGLLKLHTETPYMWIDGVQGWRNPSLLQNAS